MKWLVLDGMTVARRSTGDPAFATTEPIFEILFPDTIEGHATLQFIAARERRYADLAIDGKWYIEDDKLKARNYKGEGNAFDHRKGVIGFFLPNATDEDRTSIVSTWSTFYAKSR